MLTARNISYSISGRQLLSNVSLLLRAGEMNLVVGANGAGKSTLIRILSGQIKSYTGDVLYGEKNIRSTGELELARIRAVLSQQIEVAFPLTVYEVIMMGRYPHFQQAPSKTDKQICHEMMELFDITPLADRNYITLSGGEKQRVHFARTLAQIWQPQKNDCRYLLLDEPLTFLDIHYQLAFMQQLTDILKNQQIVALGVVHDLNLAIKYATHIILLHEGGILAQGKKEDVFTSENIQIAFRIEPTILKDEIRQSFYLAY